MKILYCNIIVVDRSGTEVVTLETTRGLAKRGHDVALYAWRTGPAAQALAKSGVKVINSLDELPWTPDVIHSNHTLESLQSAARFPRVGQVFVCHDSDEWHSGPPRISGVRQWLAVDRICAQRIHRQAGQFVGQVDLLPNAVDLETFARRSPLPQEPTRALILTKDATKLDVIQAACKRRKLHVDSLVRGAGAPVADLGTRLRKYDVVFATARMALEAAAVGCAVVVVDGRGFAGLMTRENVDAWRTENFGKAILTDAITQGAIEASIAQYSREESEAVCSRLRDVAGLDTYLLALEAYYQQVIDQAKRSPVAVEDTLQQMPAAITAFVAAQLGQPLGEFHLNDLVSQPGHDCELQLRESNHRLELMTRRASSRSRLFKRLLRVIAFGKSRAKPLDA